MIIRFIDDVDARYTKYEDNNIVRMSYDNPVLMLDNFSNIINVILSDDRFIVMAAVIGDGSLSRSVKELLSYYCCFNGMVYFFNKSGLLECSLGYENVLPIKRLIYDN